jgi:integrase
MARAGVVVTLGTEKTGKGRRFRSKGFHSFRHVCVSRLANADIPADVRKGIVGHACDTAHARYVHLALDTQRRAVAKMSSVL